MLALFPSLLFLAPLSALLLRAAAACFFLIAAYARFRNGRSVRWYVIGIIEAVAGLSLAVGYWGQAGALLGAAVTLIWLIAGNIRVYPKSTCVLLFLICLSILMTGPGAFAFDLPL